MTVGFLIVTILLQLSSAVLALRLIPVSAAIGCKKRVTRLLEMKKTPSQAFFIFTLCLLVSGCLEIVKKERGHPLQAAPLQAAPQDKWVAAKNGLFLREGPGLSHKIIEIIPSGGKVEFVEEVGEIASIGGQKGRWNKVAYKGKLGYSFGPFLDDAPIVSEKVPKSPPVAVPSGVDAKIERVKGDANGPSVLRKKNRAFEFAYKKNNSSVLIKMNHEEFEKEKRKIEHGFETMKNDFRNSVKPKAEFESQDEYLARSLYKREKTLKNIREYEYLQALKVYSIYDAKFEYGNYDSVITRFYYIGTTIEFPWTYKMITLPNNTLYNSGFANGRRYWVKIPSDKANAIVENANKILVRIDFSYSESVYDILDWMRKAYFMPKYLMIYNKNDGEIIYECGASHRVEISPNAGISLKITGDLLYETAY